MEFLPTPSSQLPASQQEETLKRNPVLEIKFCPRFACVLSWRGLIVDGDDRRRIAVNVRLAPPEEVAALPIDRFDGFGTFEDLPSTGKCVSDYWF